MDSVLCFTSLILLSLVQTRDKWSVILEGLNSVLCVRGIKVKNEKQANNKSIVDNYYIVS